MKRIEFNKEKSKNLKKDRGISFEKVSLIIKRKGFIGIVEHPNKKRYPKQRMYLVKIEEYIFIVPFVEDEEKIFLKTIYPSRKHTKKYLNK
ncbi:MAG: toxin [bacterium]|nr:toxin [bacterium]